MVIISLHQDSERMEKEPHYSTKVFIGWGISFEFIGPMDDTFSTFREPFYIDSLAKGYDSMFEHMPNLLSAPSSILSIFSKRFSRRWWREE